MVLLELWRVWFVMLVLLKLLRHRVVMLRSIIARRLLEPRMLFRLTVRLVLPRRL